LDRYQLPCSTRKPELIKVAIGINLAIYQISVVDNHVGGFGRAWNTFDHGFAHGGEKQHDSQQPV
jgi:hypothetical protein